MTTESVRLSGIRKMPSLAKRLAQGIEEPLPSVGVAGERGDQGTRGPSRVLREQQRVGGEGVNIYLGDNLQALAGPILRLRG